MISSFGTTFAGQAIRVLHIARRCQMTFTAAKPPQFGIESEQTASLSLVEVFRPNCIETIRGGTGKSSVISLLVSRLASVERIEREFAEEIIRKILERERHCSTGYGKGFAFPHLRTPRVSHFVGAIGIAPDGLNFGSMDQSPTKLVFLTLSPLDYREEHADLMSRLANLMQDKRIGLQLMQTQQPTDFYRLLCDLDESIGVRSQHLDESK